MLFKHLSLDDVVVNAITMLMELRNLTAGLENTRIVVGMRSC